MEGNEEVAKGPVQNELTAIFDPVNKALGMAASMPAHELAKIPGAKEFLANGGAIDGESEEQEEGAEEQEEGEGELPGAKKVAPKKAVAKSKSIFFGDTTPDETAYKKGDDIAAYITKKLGIESPEKFFEEHNTLKATAAEAEKAKGTVTEFQDWFKSIPQELFDVLQVYNTNGDWKASLQNMASQKIDFSRDYSQQNTFDILTHYFPEITKEEFEDDTNTTAKKAVNLAKGLYLKEQNEVSEKRNRQQEELSQNSQKVRASIQTSLNSLQKNYPTFSKEAIKNVSKAMADGSYRNLFFNEDGTFTEQAAVKLALAFYGEQELKNTASRSVKQGASEQNKILAQRSDKNPEISNSNPGKKKNPLPEQTMRFLSDLTPKNDIYSARLVK